MKNVLIKTKRLILREFKNSDWQAVHTYASDSEVIKYVNWGPNTQEDSQEFVKQAIEHQKEEPRKEYELAVILEPRGQLIGSGSIHLLKSGDKEGRLGIVLDRRFWGQGFGAEIARALIDFGFKKLKLYRISGTADPMNTSSRKLQEKIGFKKADYFKRYMWVERENRWRDRLLYAILKSDWEKND
jgi:RimJ/RimL family protein N-acetyltransferase